MKKFYIQKKQYYYPKELYPRINQPIFQFQVQNDYKTLWKPLSSFFKLEKYLIQYKNEVKILDFPFTQQNYSIQLIDVMLQFFQLLLQKTLQKFDDKILLEFIQYSPSEIHGKIKLKQGFMYKVIGGKINDGIFTNMGKLINYTRRKYFIITDKCITYSQGNTDQTCKIKQIIQFDKNFLFEFGKQTGKQFGIHINSTNSQLYLQVQNQFEFQEFIRSIIHAISFNQLQHNQNYCSFAPLRQGQASFLIDGQKYFSSVKQHLLYAKNQVFILDWWMTPFFHLTRPIDQQKEQNSRLDLILKKIAENNVKINIILYFESKFLTNNSYFTKTYLQNLQILRHPQNVLPFYWTHHEKLLIIDQEVAFLGGLDLCHGRWDTSLHSISDQDEKYFPGIDYCNQKKKNITNIAEYKKSQLNRKQEPRMPWHDVGVMLTGEVVIDLCRHFIEYWRWASCEQTYQRQIIQVKYQLCKKKQFIENQFQRNLTLSKSLLFNMKLENSSNTQQKSKSQLFNINQSQLNPTLKHHQKIELDKIIKKQKKKQQCQIVRSASTWSVGFNLNKLENSIHIAYVQLISQAKSFIYIQNQYFISSTAGSYVQNQIANALIIKIKQSAKTNTKFKFMHFKDNYNVNYELLEQNQAILQKLCLYWQYQTIYRGQNSIYNQLKDNIQNPQEYIQFYSLRNHGYIDGKPKSEIIYIHSKLMIIDDDIAIIGSANINDRSMLGNRDSQIAIIINDKQKVQGRMNGKKVQKSKFASQLRKELWKEHFQLSQNDVQDPLGDILQIIQKKSEQNTDLYRIIFHCYPDDRFSNFQDIKESLQIKDLCLQQKYKQYKDSLGRIVKYPKKFLENQNLDITKCYQKEFFMPTYIVT